MIVKFNHPTTGKPIIGTVVGRTLAKTVHSPDILYDVEVDGEEFSGIVGEILREDGDDK